MRISIWDLDWYHRFSFVPNYKAQKISSYHKQKNDLINFIEDESYIEFEYDIMYIIKEKDVTPMPPSKYIDNTKVKLIGRHFDYYDNHYILPAIIEMVRPDYSLYNVEERNSYANANMLQFLHGTKLLPARQDHINYAAKHHKKTVVVDEMLWKVEKSTLETIFNELEELKSIAFLHPISLKSIMEKDFKERFANLHFSPGTYFRFRNDYGSEFEEVKEIIDFMLLIKEKNPSIGLQGFPVKAVLYNHWDNSSLGIKDLERVLKIMDYSKRRKIKVTIRTPNERLVTPYWAFFDMLEVWTKDYYNISYLESMISTRSVKTKEIWYEIINDSKKWSTPRIYFLLHLINKYPSLIFNYGLTQWGEDILDKNWIDLKEVVKFKNYFEQDDILKKLQEEILKEVE